MHNFLKAWLPTRKNKPASAAYSLPKNHAAPLLLPTAQLDEYARRLAATHRLSQRAQQGRPLLRHLGDAAAYLDHVHTMLARDAEVAQATVPAAEWLLDNYYIIEEQIAEVKVDLPERYYRQLPKLAAGEYAGYPRIYGMAQALLFASDGLLDDERIITFVCGYQEAGHELTIGELWSVAIMLRLSLVERLSELAREMLAIHQQWQAADRIVRDILKRIGSNPTTPIALPASLSNITTPLGPVFATRLQRLREQGEAARPVLDWLERRLEVQGTTSAEMVQREVRLLTSLEELVGNLVTSMRRLSAMDWASFVEELSISEATLRRDPAAIYPQMDFATRDQYRHAIEQFARYSRYSEAQVVAQALMLAERPPQPLVDEADPGATHNPEAAQHIGYYLIDGGRQQLVQAIGYQSPPLERVASSVEAHPHRYYLGALTAVAGGLVAAAAAYAVRHDGKRGAIAAAALATLPASSLATSLVNHLITSIIKPRALPRLALKYGIPSDMSTMVVVPVLLTSVDGVREMLEHLEILALANSDANLSFAIISDFADADSEELPDDADLLRRIISGINDLNARYGATSRRFYLFHRARKWNPAEGKWMGWERKRGKLTEFNHLLDTGDERAFAQIIGDLDLLPQIRFVITLDADTELPPGAPLRLVGTMAHPLNRPLFDPHTNRVVRGYGILQPRVETTLISGNASPFARLSSGHTGVDPYTTAVSDVYQDLFGEGIFMGKGIYDVQAFSRAMKNRFPENSLLSHDLIEGVYARTALVSDITLYDDQPSRYLVAARRAHRWVRGDWQIMPWLLPHVPNERGKEVPNVLPLAARWKVFDNLRRSLEAPALLAMLVAGWTVLPGRAAVWTALATFVRAFPTVVNLLFAIPRRPPATPWHRHIGYVLHETGLNLAHLAMTTTLLPDQAQQALDAISRTLARMYFSHRHLLEWQTAADTQRRLGNRLPDYLKAMWGSPLFATSLFALILRQRRARPIVAAPYLAAWAAAPFVAWRLSQPKPPPIELAPADALYLRRAARKTWRYFATFVGPDDHWLPPDNYQEDPRPVIAHRTSPTNMSLALLATLAARDFGYLTTGAMTERLEQQLGGMEGLERDRGHFYNWYDTQTAKPLLPAYISTVDSGNLAGHLIVLKQGCLERIDLPIVGPELLAGLADNLALLEETIATNKRAHIMPAAFVTLQNLKSRIQNPPANLPEWAALLAAIARDATALKEATANLPAPKATTPTSDAAAEVHYWAGQLNEAATTAAAELDTLLPYLTHLINVPAVLTVGNDSEPATLWRELSAPPPDLSLSRSIGWCAEALPVLRQIRQAISVALPAAEAVAPLQWLEEFTTAVAAAWTACEQLTTRLRDLARQCESLIEMMRFDFLYDEGRDLFAIGYNVAEQRRDKSHYDLLASEARLASFFAISRREAPVAHWFKLGRARTPACDGYALLSWTGTMFEYLMPNLVMNSYPNSLIDSSNRAAICRQQQYGRERGVPWGISESAFSVRDRDQNYQYRAFGVPGLGLKRGLSSDLVVAPYASMLALLVDPTAATANLRRLAPAADARYGFYDAVDYTTSRLPVNQDYLPVRNYMAHHQGMSLLALDEVIHGKPMAARFHCEPQVQAVELLLQERIPLEAPITQPRSVEVESIRSLRRLPLPAMPTPHIQHFDTAATAIPEAHLLSNGRYHVMLTNSGGGYSQWQDLAVTRWRPDATSDNWGSFCYIRDIRSGRFWSSAINPTGVAPQGYGATFALDEVTYWRRDDGIETRTLVVVSPDDAEVRQVTLTNYSSRPREIEVTSYAEIVLNQAATDAAHPAFSKMFVETERLVDAPALLASRRPRTADEQHPWLSHTLAVEGDVRGPLEYETDRARFIGRGRTVAAPAALIAPAPLSGATGAVLDPIVSLRRRVRLAPGQRATFTYTTAVCASRAQAADFAHRCATPLYGERARRLAFTQNALRRRQHNLGVEQAMRYQRLASRILYPSPALRPSPELLATNQRGQSALWAYGISGDYPIVLLRIRDLRESDLLGELLRAHEYLTSLGLHTDLVVINEYDIGYQQPLHEQLQNFILSSAEAEVYNQRGGVWLLRADNMADPDRVLLLTAASVTLLGGAGSLDEQLARNRPRQPLPAAFLPTNPALAKPPAGSEVDPDAGNLQSAISDLQFFNGRGGFSADGNEYVIQLAPENTPAPWSNVITNPQFGCLVTELGVGTTWAENSRENRLTPWHNDAVSDPPAEAIYLRDDRDGALWSATPLPIRQPITYQVRHGMGYTVYQHTSHGIAQELTISVPSAAPMKHSTLRLRNLGDQPRRLTISYYAEWVMGVARADSSRYVISEWDEQAQALFAHNPYNNEFAANIAFVAADHSIASYSADRREFLGRLGKLERPAALRRVAFSGQVGAGLDPCAALQVVVELSPGAEQTLTFTMGEAKDREAARGFINEARQQPTTTDNMWQEMLTGLAVETPDAAMNLLLNRWLPYQALACRIWARSAFYQGGGAYGFRDQLQDVMAMVYTAPQLAREQILRAAARQFRAGDVQHWWHPPTGRGVRTRISDDMLWLPFVTAFYVEATGDQAILDQVIPFIEAPELKPDQEDAYLLPTVSDEHASLYEHCVRAIERGATVGPHGLPLMGTGDWNDGMNKVGAGGRGESVWLAWFLASVLDRFTPLADQRGDTLRADWCRSRRVELVNNIEQSAWDGGWYLRAWFDDGTPLGSAKDEECQIDAIAQSWSVISGFGNPDRQQQALAALNQRLIRDAERLILLLTPPFDKSGLDPGYIKGYPPGVRENGGQYTHAACWTALAFALHGDGQRAYELWSLLNPINHALDAAARERYKVEPYVVAADVYSHPDHIGRGGWTWYTGSAAWLYRVGIEALLGFRLHGDHFTVTPTLPTAWPGYRLTYRYKRTTYAVEVRRGASGVSIDGIMLADERIPLRDDGGQHQVIVGYHR